MTLRIIELDSSDNGLPIALAAAKAAVRIDHGFEDAVLKRKLWTAIQEIEHRTGRFMRPGVFAMDLAAWPCKGEIFLEAYPVRSVEALTFLPEAAGGPETVAPSEYALEKTDSGAKLYFLSPFASPSLRAERRDAITVTFEAGYALQSENETDPGLRLPERVEEAALLLFGHLVKNREGVGNPLAVIPYSLELLIQDLKIFR